MTVAAIRWKPGPRLLLGMDQTINSGSNFIVSLALARATTPSTFGRVSLAILFLTSALAISRSTVGEATLTYRVGRVPNAAPAGAYVSLAAQFGALGGACSAISVATLLGWTALLFVPLGVVLCVQDACRYLAFVKERYQFVLGADFVWLLVQALALAFGAAATDGSQSYLLASGWVVGLLVSATVLVVGLRPALGASRLAVREAWQLLRGTVPQVGLAQLDAYLSSAVIVWAAGFSALGILNVVQRTMASPIQSLLLVGNVLLIPRFTDALQRGDLATLARRAFAGYLTVLTVFAVSYALLGPYIVGNLVGAAYADDHFLFVIVGLLLLLQGLSVIPAAVLKASRRGVTILKLQALATLVGIPCVAVGSYVSGARGAAAGMCVAWACLLAGALKAVGPTLKESKDGAITKYPG